MHARGNVRPIVEARQQPCGGNRYVTPRVEVPHAVVDVRLAPSPTNLEMRTPMCASLLPRSLHQVIAMRENALQCLKYGVAQWMGVALAQLGALRPHLSNVPSKIVDAREALRHERRTRKAARPFDGLRQCPWREGLRLAPKPTCAQACLLLQEVGLVLAVASFEQLKTLHRFAPRRADEWRPRLVAGAATSRFRGSHLAQGRAGWRGRQPCS